MIAATFRRFRLSAFSPRQGAIPGEMSAYCRAGARRASLPGSPLLRSSRAWPGGAFRCRRRSGDCARPGQSALRRAVKARHSACHYQEFPIFHRLSAGGGWHGGLRGYASFAAARAFAHWRSRAPVLERTERCTGGAESGPVRLAIQVPVESLDDSQLRLRPICCDVIVTGRRGS